MLAFYRGNAPAISRAGLYLMMPDCTAYALQRISFAADDWRFHKFVWFCGTNRDKQVRGTECCDIPVPIKGKTCVSRLLSTLSLCDLPIVYYWHASVVQYVQKRVVIRDYFFSSFLFARVNPLRNHFRASSRFVRASERETSGYTQVPGFSPYPEYDNGDASNGNIRMNQQEHAGPVSEFISLVGGFAARIFASVSAIVQPSECVKRVQILSNWGIPAIIPTQWVDVGGIWLSSVELIWRQNA